MEIDGNKLKEMNEINDIDEKHLSQCGQWSCFVKVVSMQAGTHNGHPYCHQHYHELEQSRMKEIFGDAWTHPAVITNYLTRYSTRR